MKHILILVCILFSVVGMAMEPQIPGPQGGVNIRADRAARRANIRRNLFQAERRSGERLARLQQENAQAERVKAAMILRMIDPQLNPNTIWTVVRGEGSLGDELEAARRAAGIEVASVAGEGLEASDIRRLTEQFNALKDKGVILRELKAPTTILGLKRIIEVALYRPGQVLDKETEELRLLIEQVTALSAEGKLAVGTEIPATVSELQDFLMCSNGAALTDEESEEDDIDEGNDFFDRE